MAVALSRDWKKSAAEVNWVRSGGLLVCLSSGGTGLMPFSKGPAIDLKIVLVRLHERRINGQMEKEGLGLSLGNQNMAWKDLLNATNRFYDSICASPLASVDAAEPVESTSNYQATALLATCSPDSLPAIAATFRKQFTRCFHERHRVGLQRLRASDSTEQLE
jgi:hypothetical protein